MRDTKITTKKNSLFGTVIGAAALAATAALAYHKRKELGEMTKTAGDTMSPFFKSAGTTLAKGFAALAHKMDPSVTQAANDPDQFRHSLGADDRREPIAA